MSLLIPGNDPPMITPYCEFCDLPAERICFDVLTSPYRIGIHGQCCGKTSSMWLPIEDMMRARATNEKVYVVTPANHMQGLRPLPPGDISYTRAKKRGTG